jgi:hypothetical protein
MGTEPAHNGYMNGLDLSSYENVDTSLKPYHWEELIGNPSEAGNPGAARQLQTALQTNNKMFHGNITDTGQQWSVGIEPVVQYNMFKIAHN